MGSYERGYNTGYQNGYRHGIIDQYKAGSNLKGIWEFPYADKVVHNRKVGKAVKQCSNCKQTYGNNLPWNARFCPECGSDNEGEK